MPVEVVMPKFGLTMQEGTIQRWFKAEGDPITRGEPLFEVETEKVLYEVEAPADGRVARLLYSAESTVACARVVAVIALDGEDPQAVAGRYPAPGPQPVSRAARATVAAPAEHAAPRPTAPVTPAARKLAKELGIDLDRVRGSGPGGRVTREDVMAAAAAAAAAPLQGMRRSIAQHMLQSLQSTAQLTITTEADVTTLVARQARLKTRFPVTLTDLVVSATARALRAHPRLNATAGADTLRLEPDIHVGVAVALDDGLVVPVVRNADRKELAELAAETRALAAQARAGTLDVDDVSGGTFTITNLGMYGIDAFTPILHAPQVAILGIGRVIEKPAVHEGHIVPRSMMVLSLTFDHRVVDGAPAAAFLRDVVAGLQAPDAGET